jgi:hypothetical protein
MYNRRIVRVGVFELNAHMGKRCYDRVSLALSVRKLQNASSAGVTQVEPLETCQ